MHENVKIDVCIQKLSPTAKW